MPSVSRSPVSVIFCAHHPTARIPCAPSVPVPALPTSSTRFVAISRAAPMRWSASATKSFRSTSAIPASSAFARPETMRLAMIENLKASEAYCHQKGIFPAREAVVMQQQSRGVRGVTADEVFMGNGVSELIDLVLRALLSTDDEVLVPSPDYPLWTAAVNLNRGRAVHYPCRPENGFEPEAAGDRSADHAAARAPSWSSIPNNPTGAVYSRETLEAIARLAETSSARSCSAMRSTIRSCTTMREFVPMATLVQQHAVRHDVGAVQGVSRMRLSRRLGCVLRRARACARISQRARQAFLAALVQQRARPVGSADGARRLSEHPSS